MAAFSRLQLAAALLEYDNDPDNPSAPFRSAHESAIFLPFRRNAANNRKSEYQPAGVGSEVGSYAGKDTVLKARISRGSIGMLRNPFGADTIDSEADEQEEEEMEVDLASWGLDQFIPKGKGMKDVKGKGKAMGHTVSTVRSHKPHTNNDSGAPRRILGSRSMSVGNLDFHIAAAAAGEGSSHPPHPDDMRRRSFGSPLDLAGVVPSQELLGRRRASSNPLVRTLPELQELQEESPKRIPFPSASVRAPSPTNPKALMQNELDIAFPSTEDNPFAIRPPSRGSRFDPKVMARVRSTSNASIGTRQMLDNDGASVMTAQPPRDPRYSTTLELLRPKVLVMPSPLQPVSQPTLEPTAAVRDGFQLSTDGPPLPPGARSGGRMSMMNVLDNPPLASNSFTPNVSTNLTLSQKIFRNTLAVGGVADGEALLPKVTRDGDQVKFDIGIEDASPAPRPPVDENGKAIRPPGKLFGRSLIDDLENRKLEMRSKQRVFTGDQRPSMMARQIPTRQSTLIDPASLQARPVTAFGPPEMSAGLARRASVNIKPLLNFDDDKTGLPTANRAAPQNRSVFGVDTLWEREMAKLKEMEAQERLDEEERKKREEEEEKKPGKKGNKKNKKNRTEDAGGFPVPASQGFTSTDDHVLPEPPVLPQIPKAITRGPPPAPADDDDDDDSENSDVMETPVALRRETDNWHADSSDDEMLPHRTTGTGLRYPANVTRPTISTQDESDEDVPLSMAATRAKQRGFKLPGADDESDEEKPLSVLLDKGKLGLPPMKLGGLSLGKSDDEDDQPLGIRASRLNPLGAHTQRLQQTGNDTGEDDDDQPLGMHPEQQRRTQQQMQMMAQQQQFMMQAQFQNSMFFNPAPMIAPGFYGPPMMPPMMMQPPVPIPSPPPMHDAAKFGRVDQWRRNVAVDTDP